MNIIAKEISENHPKTAEKVNYKASYITAEGIVHRVDFDTDGRIENLCVYTGFSPSIRIEDLENLIGQIKQTIQTA